MDLNTVESHPRGGDNRTVPLGSGEIRPWVPKDVRSTANSVQSLFEPLQDKSDFKDSIPRAWC